MRKHLVAVGLFSAVAFTGVMTLTLTSNDIIPVKEKGLRLSCLTPGEFTNFTIDWIHPQNVKLSTCFPKLPLCTSIDSRYNFTKDNNGAYAYINSLDRTKDSGAWSCEYATMKANIEIIVYTFPSGLSITQNPDQDVDLSEMSVELQCKTTNCTYPMPTIKWIFKATIFPETQYATISPTETQESCTSPEMVYTSILQIPRYTTFSDNSDKTGTFFCRIEYSGISWNSNLSSSKNVRFAVNLTSVTLKDSNGNVSPNLVNFVNGSPVTLFCTTSPSWPAANVSWFIDTMQITSGINNSQVSSNGLLYVESRLTLTPSNKDHHNKKIYCLAYTINNNTFLQSVKNLMFVKVTPDKPINFHATNIQERQLSLMWQSGYHVQFPQSFVVETSQDNITWTNVSLVSDGSRDGWFTTVIENLNSGSKYYLRLYGYNENGRGEFADVQLAVQMWKECLCTPSIMDSVSAGITVGGAVGIGVGGVVLGCIGAIIAFTIGRQLNGSKSSCFSRKGKMDDITHTYSNTEMTPEAVKPIYEELSKGTVEHNMYDKISPITDGT